jgi:muconolactone delta-isomerase
MLYFVNIRVKTEGLSLDELWDIWEPETEAALGAKGAGKVVDLYKVSGQRRVLVIMDVDSNDELDQILMAGLPMAHELEMEEVLPLRAYEDFAEDIRNRWGARS